MTSPTNRLAKARQVGHPKVSVIVPCRNEAQFISACLDSIVNNDYPKDRLEILVIDGMSEDSTRSIVNAYDRTHAIIRILDNPKKHVTAAVNVGVTAAKGEVIMIMGGAHATYASNYISNCVRCLQKYNVENVGGVIVAISADETLAAKGIALAISHPFGAGNSYFRIVLRGRDGSIQFLVAVTEKNSLRNLVCGTRISLEVLIWISIFD